ncbi:MAG: rgpA 2 [Bacteroidetes bacterium]|nr:rgpA 2 [Bacteroidota bacterium]
MRELFIRSMAALFTWLALVSNAEYAQAQSKISSTSAFTLLQQQPGGWKVDYAPSLSSPVTIDVEGIPHLLFNEGSGSREGEPGKPHLPVEALTLGLPGGAELRVEITDPIYQDSRDQFVAPNPTYTFTEEKEAVAAYVKDPTFYSQNRFFPQQTIVVEAPYSVRLQRMSTIRVAPYQYNPATKVLKQLVKATLNIRMVSSTNQPLDVSPVSYGTMIRQSNGVVQSNSRALIVQSIRRGIGSRPDERTTAFPSSPTVGTKSPRRTLLLLELTHPRSMSTC